MMFWSTLRFSWLNQLSVDRETRDLLSWNVLNKDLKTFNSHVLYGSTRFRGHAQESPILHTTIPHDV